MSDVLRSHLSDLAEEVVSVDLRDRSLSTARRIGARRAVLATSVAAALVAVAAVAALALRPASQDSMPPAGSPTRPWTPSATPVVPASIDATTYYLRRDADGGRVYSLAVGRLTEEYAISAPADDPCVGNSAVVSPDGRYLAWVEQVPDPARSGVFGTLTVSRLDGTDAHDVEDVTCAMNERAWAADSSALTVRVGQASSRDVDPATGATRPSRGDRFVWSAGRSFRAYQADTPELPLVVEDASGRPVHTVDYRRDDTLFQTCGYIVKGVSDDGRYVIIGACSTDASRVMFGHHLYDMVTKTHVILPDPRMTVIGFVKAGNVLLRTDGERAALVLITPDGRVLDQVTEPTGLRDAAIIGYRP